MIRLPLLFAAAWVLGCSPGHDSIEVCWPAERMNESEWRQDSIGGWAYGLGCKAATGEAIGVPCEEFDKDANPNWCSAGTDTGSMLSIDEIPDEWTHSSDTSTLSDCAFYVPPTEQAPR